MAPKDGLEQPTSGEEPVDEVDKTSKELAEVVASQHTFARSKSESRHF